jgi:hypothetical protein
MNLAEQKVWELGQLAPHTGMNMQYAEAVIAHEHSQTRRLALTPNVHDARSADLPWHAMSACLPLGAPTHS